MESQESKKSSPPSTKSKISLTKDFVEVPRFLKQYQLIALVRNTFTCVPEKMRGRSPSFCGIWTVPHVLPKPTADVPRLLRHKREVAQIFLKNACGVQPKSGTLKLLSPGLRQVVLEHRHVVGGAEPVRTHESQTARDGWEARWVQVALDGTKGP